MRILEIGGDNDRGAMDLRLAVAGHEGRVHVDDPQSHDVLDGMTQRIPEDRAQLEWARDGILVFETTGHGVVQDALRADGSRVVSGSAPRAPRGREGSDLATHALRRRRHA